MPVTQPRNGVAGGLHEPLAVHDALALVLVLARARVGSEHRRAGLLDLQEQRIVVAVAHQQDHQRLGPDRADADDLAREVLVVVVVEHDAPIGAPGSARSREALVDDLLEVARTSSSGGRTITGGSCLIR